MDRYFKQSKLLLFAYFILCLAASCGTEEKKEEPNDTAVTQNADAGKGKVEPAFTEGKLDTLYIEREAFDTIPNAKILFSFTFAGPDSLTLHGWLYKPGGGHIIKILIHYQISDWQIVRRAKTILMV